MGKTSGLLRDRLRFFYSEATPEGEPKPIRFVSWNYRLNARQVADMSEFYSDHDGPVELIFHKKIKAKDPIYVYRLVRLEA